MMWFRSIVTISLLVFLSTSVQSEVSASKEKCFGKDCIAATVQVFNNGDWSNGNSLTLTVGECDISKDLGEIICPKLGFEGPCSLYSAWGTRVTNCVDLKTEDNVFMVPEGRLFMIPTRGIGYRTELTHIGYPAGKPIVLETLSEYPRIFRVTNFMSEAEADQMMQNALALDDDAHMLKRSSTGTNGYTVDTRRTSENAFDTKSDLAIILKKRTFDLLGISPYDESFADGIQVLRYNESTGYATHMDWIAPPAPGPKVVEHDYDSAGQGTNRFATMLLYMSDTEEGGETVFPYVDRHTERDPAVPIHHSQNDNRGKSQYELQTKHRGQDQADADTLQYLADRNLTDVFPPHSWQRESVQMCRTRLTVKPRKTEAVLFYSTTPDGKPDYLSTHGACPVISGQKWAANLWVWNGPRTGYWKKNEETGKFERPVVNSVSASFESRDVEHALLYWEDQLWEELNPGRPVKVNTFSGHKWSVRHNERVVLHWTIGDKSPNQRFVLTAEDLPVLRNAVKIDNMIHFVV